MVIAVLWCVFEKSWLQMLRMSTSLAGAAVPIGLEKSADVGLIGQGLARALWLALALEEGQ